MLQKNQNLRLFVVGVGSFGKNHLRVYRDLAASGAAIEVAAIIDSCATTLSRASSEFGLRGFSSIADAIDAVGVPDGASICVPTDSHGVTAKPLLSAGVHCLIEKPLANSLREADQILETARAHEALVQVGHLERFNPAVRAAKAHLNRPMFFESHRLSVFTPRSLDIDVVLDLMIHDLDIVLSFVDSHVREIRAVGLPVLSRNVDIANVRVAFENGCIANFTASRVSTERVRKLRFFQHHQYVSLDFARQDLLLIDVTRATNRDQGGPSLLDEVPQQGEHPSPGLSLTKVKVGTGEPLRLEIESFLRTIRTGDTLVVSGEEGRRALALALAINEAIRGHNSQMGLTFLN